MVKKSEAIGRAIREARKQNALSQEELAEKLKVSQGSISNWERGEQEPDEDTKARLQSVLGANFLSVGQREDAGGPSIVSAWLSKARQEADLTVAQVAQKSGLSAPTIYSIEAGKAQNPRQRTMALLEKALGRKFDPEFQASVKEASTIEGLGEFQDFEPHDENDWPAEAGIYVFYDISDRPIYVGMGSNIADRIAAHQDKFWFKRPVVERAAYVSIKNEKLRRQIETILIKFLKSNAIINKQGVERD